MPNELFKSIPETISDAYSRGYGDGWIAALTNWKANYGHPFTCAHCRDAGIRDEKSEWWTWEGFAEHMNGAHPGLPWEPRLR